MSCEFSSFPGHPLTKWMLLRNVLCILVYYNYIREIGKVSYMLRGARVLGDRITGDTQLCHHCLM